jgi:hypothetical protein
VAAAQSSLSLLAQSGSAGRSRSLLLCMESDSAAELTVRGHTDRTCLLHTVRRSDLQGEVFDGGPWTTEQAPDARSR